MTLEQLIKDYKLNQSALAGIIGKSQAAFHEKLNNSRGNKFSHEQKCTIIAYLLELSEAIHKVE